MRGEWLEKALKNLEEARQAVGIPSLGPERSSQRHTRMGGTQLVLSHSLPGTR